MARAPVSEEERARKRRNQAASRARRKASGSRRFWISLADDDVDALVDAGLLAAGDEDNHAAVQRAVDAAKFALVLSPVTTRFDGTR
jgi:hypothetical protein